METPGPGTDTGKGKGAPRGQNYHHQVAEVPTCVLTYGLVFQRLLPSPNLGRFSQEQQKAHPKGLLHLPNFTTLLQTTEKQSSERSLIFLALLGKEIQLRRALPPHSPPLRLHCWPAADTLHRGADGTKILGSYRLRQCLPSVTASSAVHPCHTSAPRSLWVCGKGPGLFGLPVRGL